MPNGMTVEEAIRIIGNYKYEVVGDKEDDVLNTIKEILTARDIVLDAVQKSASLMKQLEETREAWNNARNTILQRDKELIDIKERASNLEKITDIILKVAMAHHDDISKSDEDNAVNAASAISEGIRREK